jgi:hypothetical protein
MSRNRPPDSSRRAQPGSTRQIDIPVLVVSALTVLFAALFTTLLVLRPDSSNPAEAISAAARSRQAAPRVIAPTVDAPPVSAQPVSAQPVEASRVEVRPIEAPSIDASPVVASPVSTPPPVSAAPPEPILTAEPKHEPVVNPATKTRLQELGIKCAQGVDCYRD